jgi:hypothetical protein
LFLFQYFKPRLNQQPQDVLIKIQIFDRVQKVLYHVGVISSQYTQIAGKWCIL